MENLIGKVEITRIEIRESSVVAFDEVHLRMLCLVFPLPLHFLFLFEMIFSTACSLKNLNLVEL